MHYYATKFLCLATGCFSLSDCETIAQCDEGVDYWVTTTLPINLNDWHFPSWQDVENHWGDIFDNSAKCKPCIVGMALHMTQDYFSHTKSGYSKWLAGHGGASFGNWIADGVAWCFGVDEHSWGHDPDSVYENQILAREAVLETLKRLCEVAKRCRPCCSENDDCSESDDSNSENTGPCCDCDPLKIATSPWVQYFLHEWINNNTEPTDSPLNMKDIDESNRPDDINKPYWGGPTVKFP